MSHTTAWSIQGTTYLCLFTVVLPFDDNLHRYNIEEKKRRDSGNFPIKKEEEKNLWKNKHLCEWGRNFLFFPPFSRHVDAHRPMRLDETRAQVSGSRFFFLFLLLFVMLFQRIVKSRRYSPLWNPHFTLLRISHEKTISFFTVYNTQIQPS